jgi:PKD repeat protein
MHFDRFSSLMRKLRPSGRSRRLHRISALLFPLCFTALILPGQRVGQLMHGANGTADRPNDPSVWTTGALNGAKAHYAVGASVPYRLELSHLVPGQIYCVTIAWDTRTRGKNAIDFLTTYRRADWVDPSGRPAPQVDPLAGTALQGRAISPFIFPIPVPGTTGSPIPGMPAAAFEALPVEARQFAIFNGAITSLRYVRDESLAAWSSTSALEVCFQVNEGESAAVLAWGAHLAHPDNWGPGNTLESLPGVAAQVYLEGCTGLSGCGRQTRSIIGSAILPDANCGISGPALVCAGEEVVFTALGGGARARYSWTLSNGGGAQASIQGPRNQAQLRVRTGASGGGIKIEVHINDGPSCSRFIQVMPPGPLPLTPAVQDLCLGALPAPLTLPGFPFMEELAITYELRDSQGRLLGQAASPDSLWSHLTLPFDIYTVRARYYPDGFEDCATHSTPAVLRFVAPPTGAIATSAACAGQSIQFQSLIQGNEADISAYSWEFGDGGGSESPHPEHTYVQAGEYLVKLTLWNQAGCARTIERMIKVSAGPQAGFSADDHCLAELAEFAPQNNAGEAPIVWHEWDFGDGFGSLLSSPVHRYAEAGRYTVRLLVTDENGCSDAHEEELAVYRLPEARFSTPEGCQGLEVSFSNHSLAGDWPLRGNRWDFGDGQSSIEEAPAHRYAQPGEYLARLEIHDEQGCAAQFEAKVEAYAPALVDAGGDKEICQGESITLSGRISGGVSSGQWSDGGRGGRFDPSPRTLQAVYTPPANFSGEIILRLTSDDPFGPCPSVSDELRLIVRLPAVVLAGPDQSICQGERAQLQGVISGSARSGQWSDGGAGGIFLPSSTALEAWYVPPPGFTGDIKLTLRSLGLAGPCPPAVDELHLSVFAPVKVDAGQSQSICEGESLRLSGAIRGAAGGYWSDSGRGGTFHPSPRDLNARYAPPANYSGQIVLTLTSDAPPGPCPAAARAISLWVWPKPKADFIAAPVCQGQLTNFTNLSAGAGEPLRYEWDFGDGNRGQDTHPRHRYAQAGEYQVQLRVIDAQGCAREIIRTVNIWQRPVANFSVGDACPGQVLRFANTSKVTPGHTPRYQWDFGDGGGSREANPMHVYASPGAYRVLLTVSDDNGCANTLGQTIVVKQAPRADFTAAPVCADAAMVFVNRSQAGDGAIVDYEWDFGDGSGSLHASPSHTYARPGKYIVALTARDLNGCAHRLEREVEVFALPEAIFNASAACHGEPVFFNDRSRPGSGRLVAYEWDFGDGQTSRLSNPEHLYRAPGRYTARLRIVDEHGCRGAGAGEIEVLAPPIARFQVEAACVSDEHQALNQSQVGSRPLKSFDWDFGDGQRSQDEQPRWRYQTPGSYTVNLSVVDQAGCTHTATRKVEALPLPRPAFTHETFCADKSVVFTYRGENAQRFKWFFGDGQNSEERHPRHRYAQAGQYRTRLEVWTAQGCQGVVEGDVLLSDPPLAAFVAEDACEAPGPNFRPLNQSRSTQGDDARLLFYWVVSDEQGRAVASSEASSPAFDLPQGRYTLNLTVREGENCVSEALADFQIVATPQVSVVSQAQALCPGQSTRLTATFSGGLDCGVVQWQTAAAPLGPWNNIVGAVGPHFDTPAELIPGIHYFRARYRCEGASCAAAISNVIAIEIGAQTVQVACVDQVNVRLDDDCRARLRPEMVANGRFGECFPYRAEDFEVIVYDGMYPNGAPDNVIEKWGSFSYVLRLTAAAQAAGARFEPCWGTVNAADLTPPVLSCAGDVSGLVRFRQGGAERWRPAANAEGLAGGERFHPLICTDILAVLREERSWNDPSYPYYMGFPVATDACGEVRLLTVNDVLEEFGCGLAHPLLGGALSARITRTFTFADELNNQSTCRQYLYFAQATPQLPLCEVNLDWCAHRDDATLVPFALGIAPFLLNALGDTLPLSAARCGYSAIYEDLRFPGREACGYQIFRQWRILSECGWGSAPSCPEQSSISGKILNFEQFIRVEDSVAPAVHCPAGTQEFYVGAFQCTATLAPAPPVATGECEAWTWEFELYGEVVDPRTLLREYRQIGKSRDGVLSGVGLGDYDLVYVVTDACGNVGRSEKCPLRVLDRNAPVAVCGGERQVSIGGGNNHSGIAAISAADLDQGSHDNCGPVTLSARRAVAEDCREAYLDAFARAGLRFAQLRAENHEGRTLYFDGATLIFTLEEQTLWTAPASELLFGCCDIGSMAIELIVTDAAGNVNRCATSVLVEDKLAPSCQARDTLIYCTELNFDPLDPVQVAAVFGAPEAVVHVRDNCGVDISERLEWFPGDCGRGRLERIFTVVDASGNVATCVQSIVVEELIDYEVVFPPDVNADGCGPTDFQDIVFQSFGCDLLAIRRDTTVLDIPGEACLKWQITYEIVNWCEYEGLQTTPTFIIRDVNQDGRADEPTWLRVAFDPEFDAIVAKVYGADAEGRREVLPRQVFRSGDPGYTAGFFRYTQIVKVDDRTPPTLTLLSEEQDFCGYGETGEACAGQFRLEWRASDNCPANAVRAGAPRLFAGDGFGEEWPLPSDLTIAPEQDMHFTATGSLPLGEYRLSISFADGCGNTTNASVEFRIIDCQAPAPVCKELLVVDLHGVDTNGDGRPDAGIQTVRAEAFIASHTPDCSPFPDEPHGVKYFVSRVAPQNREDLIRQSVDFSCADLGVVDVFVSAQDAAGNYSFCLVKAVVQSGNQPDPCNPTLGNGVIAGQIQTEEGLPVENVKVGLSGQIRTIAYTGPDGAYHFSGLEEGYDYTVFPYYNENWLNGVSTFDLVLIQKHILQEELLSSPYKMIAADANSDRRITVFDLYLLRQLILHLSPDVPGNTSWRFVSGNYRFPDPANPWTQSFPEVINVNDLFSMYEQGRFVAIKVGDVNATAKTNALQNPEWRSANAEWRLETEHLDLKAGQRYVIPFSSSQLAGISAYQFTLALDSRYLKWVDIEYGLARAEHFGLFPEQGFLTTSWLAPPGDADPSNGHLFSLVVEAIADVYLAEAFRVRSLPTRAEAYDPEGRPREVELHFNDPPPIEEKFWATHYPNPWREAAIVEFHLPRAGAVRMNIHDAGGRLLRTIQGDFSSGHHQITLQGVNLPAGLLFFTLEFQGQRLNRRMIRLP